MTVNDEAARRAWPEIRAASKAWRDHTRKCAKCQALVASNYTADPCLDGHRLLTELGNAKLGS